MKVNELRIGNLLDNGHNIVQVTSISLDIDDEYTPTIGVCKHGEHRNEFIINEAAFGIEVKPIPLTPEWLERCGFVYNAPFYIKRPLVISKNAVRDGSGDYDGFILRVKIEDGMQHMVIKHLHHLQNIFHSLTGEELNVKL